MVIGGAAEYAAETEFETLWDGVWWAVVTVTTVGYGDLTPHTVGGRVVGIALMFVGISFLSLLTAAIASRFVREERSSEHTEMMDALHQIQAELAELKARTGGY